ncbi:phosphonatase-like hydrolase [Cyclobacterium amurskyense]|uniref:Phosphonoacetaldehyde hydrolase n=1 Tax=Cyclobacterium amurskyense TaxID=320787 RepID=A0A0H4P5J2_9BACT|nr:phosphonatase-like hydrolase [Cyclobacterium amurskyense]AKP49686.1 Phosphonoacetaldehyde hydrolase [Cyclobacterium amurskyense]|tara:strand:- start:2384 stop:3076 length:693 start_codon:yes stop_codon:yes gene_type:complete
MKNIKLVVLDMAGTTVDEDNVVYKTVQKVINDKGFNVSLEEVLAHGAGKEKHQAITDVLKACTNSTDIASIASEAFANFKPTLKLTYEQLEVKTFPGVKEMMKGLRSKGVFVVLNTGYDRKTALSLLLKLGWETGKDIDGLVTADDVLNGRPQPDMIYKAMKICGITESQEVLKAGDSTIDIEEGKNANCGLTIGVLTGAQNEKQLKTAHPDYILPSLASLPEVLAVKGA